MKNLILFLCALLMTGMVYGQTTTNYGANSGTGGNYNSFFGQNAGRNVGTTGTHNTFLGVNAGRSNTTGKYNVCIGLNAGNANTTGQRNIFIGSQAGQNETGSNKLHIGTNPNQSLIYGDFVAKYVAIGDLNYNVDIVSTPEYGLYVAKGIMGEKVKVAIKKSNSGTDWSDYVFEADYKRNSIEDVDAFVKKNKHLPNVPSAEEVYKNGIDLGQMDATLLRQIEELWLHMIDMKKENEVLKEEIKTLKEQ